MRSQNLEKLLELLNAAIACEDKDQALGETFAIAGILIGTLGSFVETGEISPETMDHRLYVMKQEAGKLLGEMSA